MVQQRGGGMVRVILGAGLLVKCVRVLTALFAAILALHIAMVVFEVDPDNVFADHAADLADQLDLGIEDVFTPKGIKARALLNSGLAAAIWLAISAVLTKLISLGVRAVAR